MYISVSYELYSAVYSCSAAKEPVATLPAPVKVEGGSFLLTVFLSHDKSKLLSKINEERPSSSSLNGFTSRALRSPLGSS